LISRGSRVLAESLLDVGVGHRIDVDGTKEAGLTSVCTC
jgi:hypothetical protein